MAASASSSGEPQSFTFDAVAGEECDQAYMYQRKQALTKG